MTTLTKCEVVEFKITNISPTAWEAKAAITEKDKYAQAVSFCANEDCTLLFLNPNIFDMETLFLEGGVSKEVKVKNSTAGDTTEIKVLVAGTIATVLQVRLQVHVCGGPRIIVP